MHERRILSEVRSKFKGLTMDESASINEHYHISGHTYNNKPQKEEHCRNPIHDWGVFLMNCRQK